MKVCVDRALLALAIIGALNADVRASSTFSTPQPIHYTYTLPLGTTPSIAIGDKTEIVAWQSTDVLDGTLKSAYHILFSRSADHGKTWSKQAPLNNNAAANMGEEWTPCARTDGIGNWVVVWSTNSLPSGALGPVKNIFYTTSSDDGVTWTDAMPLNKNFAAGTGDNLNPQIATDGSGVWIAVWQSNDTLGGELGATYHILFARSSDNGMTWSDPAPVSPDAAVETVDETNSQLSTDKVGNWTVIWQSNGDIIRSRSIDNGVTWSTGLRLDSNAATDGGSSPQIAGGTAGRWIAVWQNGNSGSESLYFSVSNDGALTWTTPQMVPGSTASQISACDPVVIYAAGVFIIAWCFNDSLPEINFIKTSDNGSTWSNITQAGPLKGWSATPQLAVDNGGVITAICDLSFKSNPAGGIFPLIISGSSDGGDSWSPPRVFCGLEFTNLSVDLEPQLATDETGIWIAVSMAGFSGYSLNDVLFSRSNDGGASWTAPAAIYSDCVSDNRSNSRPSIATDKHGNWIVVWVAQHFVYSSTSLDNGVTWSEPIQVSTAVADWDGAKIATDGAGKWNLCFGSGGKILDSLSLNVGASWLPAVQRNQAVSGYNPDIRFEGGTWVLAWSSFLVSNENGVIYSCRSTNGVTFSTPVNINSLSGYGEHPAIAGCGGGVWIAVWDDGATQPETQISISRSVDDGVSWSVPATVDTGRPDYRPAIASDGQGRIFLTWNTYTNGASVISESDDNGITWSAAASLDTDNVLSIYSPSPIVSDKSGTWVVLTSHYIPNDNSNHDIYCSRLNTVHAIPVASDGVLIVYENEIGTGTLTAADANAGPLTYLIVSDPRRGVVNIDSGAGTYSYTPGFNLKGSDSFTFRVSDGINFSNTATVTITVNPGNDIPLAIENIVSTFVNTAASIQLQAVDDNVNLTYSVVTGPSNGTLSGTAPNLIYTPAAGYHGPDSFTFKANDGHQDSNPASVTLSIVKRPLTVGAINQSTTFGEAIPALTISYTGFVNDDTPENLISQPIATTTASIGSSVGQYNIKVGGGISDVYSFTYVSGTLNITKATPVVSWTNPAEIIFGTSLNAMQLNATASVPGTFVYGPPFGTVLSIGSNQTLSATFIPTDAANYMAVNKSVLINVLNPAPVITSSPSSTPNPATVGQVVTFSSAAKEINGDALFYDWTFGDSSGGTGAITSHTYTSPGTYAVTVTVSNLSGQKVSENLIVQVLAALIVLPGSTLIDSNGDGIPDQMQSAADALSVNHLAAQLPLPELKLSIRLNFAKSASDEILLSGVFDSTMASHPSGMPIIVDVGGIVRTFKLNSAGRFKSGGKSFAVTFSKAKPGKARGLKFELKLTKGNFATMLMPAGLANADLNVIPVNIPIAVIFDANLWATTKSLTYSAKKDRVGKTSDR
jgi:hypothetical protein